MALDYIIVGMQLVGISVNVLALCSFWISPGLRATANRFVINLLVANIIACLALTPSLWMNGGLKTRYQQLGSNSIETNTKHILASADLEIRAELPKSLDDTLIESLEITATNKPLHHQHHHHRNRHHGKVERDVEQPEILDTLPFSMNPKNVKESIESVIIQDGEGIIRAFSAKEVINSGDKTDVMEEIEPMSVVTERELEIESINTIKQRSSMAHRTHTVFSENSLIFDCTRFFGFDFAAAVGVLSVVLVVGDTWCAVVDPLRYHSRISYLKSWMLIASVWAVSIVITAISALRSKWCQIDLNLDNASVTGDEDYTNASTTATFSGSSQAMFVANIYALVFSSLYFMLLVLAPIAVVCIMYYNIFSEARQSSLRMRRNGSSPLLQSALNLHNSSINAVALNDNQRYPSIYDDVSSPDAITMKIDSQQFSIEDGKTCEYNKKAPIGTHHQYRRYLDIPEGENQQQQQQTDKSLCKRQRTKSEKSLNGFKPKLSQIHRHLSARHLEKACDVPSFLTKNHNLSRIITGEMLQVHSSPNLQKLSNLDLMHKVPYCVNNQSTTSINQASQQATNSPRALSYMVSIRHQLSHRLSNASSIFKYREESRAARIGIVVVAMLMLSYLPYGLLILLQGRLTFIPNASIFSILFLLIAIVTSPFIFAYRNRRVRRGVCRLFGVDTTKTNSYLQKQRMQLRNAQSNKHVRIHRNISASNFSLNMLPYKLATSNSMLPIHNEQMHGTIQSRHDSVLVPIDDVETESNEHISCENLQHDFQQKQNDDNNNQLNKIEMVDEKVQKDKKSLLQRICRNSLRKISTSDMAKEQAEAEQQIEIKNDAI